jgi:HlyD family secretion protein
MLSRARSGEHPRTEFSATPRRPVRFTRRQFRATTQLKPFTRAVGSKAVIVPALLLLLLVVPALVALRQDGLRQKLKTSLLPGFGAAADGPVNADAVEVKRGAISKALVLDGELRAVRSRTIFVSLNDEAKITYLPPEGSTVKAGERLVELDSSTVLTRIKEAEEKIIAAENEIVRTRSTQEATLREMEVELSRLRLAYDQAVVKARVPAEVVARREYQDAQFALDKAKTEYDMQLAKIAERRKEFQAEQQVKTIEVEKIKVELNQAKGNLDGMNVRAPSDGMALYTDHWNERRKIQVGDVVWGGFPVVSLPDLSEMEVLAHVNEVDGPKLSVGDKAVIKLDSYPDAEITGAVKDISQTAVKASPRAQAKVFKVVVALDRTITETMKPGMSAQISIVVDEHPALLVVLRGAVQFERDGARVARVEGENLQRVVAVTVVATDARHYGLADGGALKAGDRILIR